MIQTLAIVIPSIVCLIISVFLFRRAAGSMSLLRLNTISYVFYFQIITTAFVASIFLATGAIDYHAYAKPISFHTKIEAWAWVMYSIIAMPLGMLLLNSLMKVRPLDLFKKYLQKDVNIQYSDGQLIWILTAMAIIGIAIITVLLVNLEHVPLFTLLFERDAGKAAIERVSVRYLPGWIDYFRGLFGLMLLPIFAYFSYIICMTRRKWYFYGFFILLCGIAILMLTFDTQKAPVAFFVLGFLIIQTIISKGIPLKYFLLFGVLPIILLLIAYQLTTDANAIDLFLRPTSAFYGRVFLSGYFAFPLSLELFPEVIAQPTYYSGIPSFVLAFLDIESTESARLLMMHMNPEGVKAGTANLFSGYYLGEAYANYGYLGLIISPFIVGWVVQIVHLFLLKHPKHPLIIAFYAFITVKWLLGAGVVSFVYLKIILFPFIFYLLIKYIVSSVSKLSK